MNKSGIKVFAPATVSNLAVGFDILGFAIDKPGDELIVREGKKRGLVIHSIKGYKESIPKDPQKNTAGVAALSLLKHLDLIEEPIEIDLIKNMRIGTGLGSSASSAVAAVFGINEFLGCPLTKKELMPFALEGEYISGGDYHADNIAPSLLGGMILIRDYSSDDYINIPVPKGLFCSIIHPHVEILTRESRSILPKEVSLQMHVKQSSHLGSFISSMFLSDFELMSRSLQDFIVEPVRSKLIPFYDEMKEIAISEGAIGFNISGSGPSVFALCQNSLVAENIIEKIQKLLFNKGVECDHYLSGINMKGAFKY